MTNSELIEYQVLAKNGEVLENFVIQATDFNHAVSEVVDMTGSWANILAIAQTPYSITGIPPGSDDR